MLRFLQAEALFVSFSSISHPNVRVWEYEGVWKLEAKATDEMKEKGERVLEFSGSSFEVCLLGADQRFPGVAAAYYNEMGHLYTKDLDMDTLSDIVKRVEGQLRVTVDKSRVSVRVCTAEVPASEEGMGTSLNAAARALDLAIAVSIEKGKEKEGGGGKGVQSVR